MRKIILFVVFAIVFSISNVLAAIITVDNKTPSAGDYSSLQAAHDAASPGDTIYVSPSGVPYSLETVTKTLSFYGTGFDYPAEGMDTTLLDGTMIFSSGSDGSKLAGFGNNGFFRVIIDADNVFLEKNKISRIEVNENHTGSVILQNFIYDYSYDYEGTASINIHPQNEVLIANNLIINNRNGTQYRCILGNNSSISLTIIHNILSGYRKTALYYFHTNNSVLDIKLSNKFVANNIILKGDCGMCRASDLIGFFHNMSNAGQFAGGNGNLTDVNMSAVFVDSSDYDFHLLPDSPAIGAGMNGVDMGIYGGSTPFVDGGRPGLPSIVNLEADHMGSQLDGLDVTIRAKSNRE